jgi:hypothetical protein
MCVNSGMAAIELHMMMDAEGEPIAGFLSAGGEERAVRFAGWVELVQAIERVRSRHARPTTRRLPAYRPLAL